ncbi:MAG TPA: hypothetical protein VHE30_20805 [Polyangiaceae bacterium]|nr:hypothetical protein [Polyangiaceae bacterium]
MSFRSTGVGSLVIVALASGCGHALPSPVPLGVGPLPRTYHLAHGRAHVHEDRRGREASSVVEPAAPEVPADEPADRPPPAPSTTASAAPAAPETPPGKVATGADFVGEYRGEDVSTYRLSGSPERADRDPNARINVTSSDKSKIDLVLIDSSNGKELCTLGATLGDGTATVTPGQGCFEQNTPEASASATVTRGTAHLEGKRLVLDMALAFEMHVPGEDATGTLDYHFEGSRN